MSNSPWSAWAVIQQVQAEIAATPGLGQGGVLILDESADKKAGDKSTGSGRHYNGRLGKMNMNPQEAGISNLLLGRPRVDLLYHTS